MKKESKDNNFFDEIKENNKKLEEEITLLKYKLYILEVENKEKEKLLKSLKKDKII